MDNNEKYFISLLAGFVNGQKPAAMQGIDWERVFKLSKIHSVSGMIYLMARGLKEEQGPKSELLLEMKKDFVSTAILSACKEEKMETILREMNEAQIPHVLMKGFVLKNYYPSREMRTMGDIDILIKPEDRDKSHELFKELGFEPTITYGEVWTYKKNTVYLEIHTKIMSRNMHNGTDYVEYFSDAWDHTVKTQKEYTFEFEKEYHFLFLMVHMAKHFDGSGCGIRMVMDIAVFLKYFKDNLNLRYIEEELEKLNLTLFSRNIYILCKRWFNAVFEFELQEMEESFYGKLGNYILSAGTFGFHDRNFQAGALRNEYLECRADGRRLTHIAVIINTCRKKLFPSYKIMMNTKYSPLIKNMPPMLPLVWIFRLIEYIFEDPKKYYRVPYSIIKGREESKDQFNIFSKLGL